jgi:hypothetical protein
MIDITAQKARELAMGSDVVSQIRNDLNIMIEENAKKGFFKMDTYVYKDHPSELVIESLKRDGFKASCRFQTDKDGSFWMYSIRW